MGSKVRTKVTAVTRGVINVSLFILLVIGLTGCGVHLYNGTQDALAKQAKVGFEKVDLAALAATRRANIEREAAMQAEAAGNLAAATRDLELLNVVWANSLRETVFAFPWIRTAEARDSAPNYPYDRLVRLNLTKPWLIDSSEPESKGRNAGSVLALRRQEAQGVIALALRRLAESAGIRAATCAEALTYTSGTRRAALLNEIKDAVRRQGMAQALDRLDQLCRENELARREVAFWAELEAARQQNPAGGPGALLEAKAKWEEAVAFAAADAAAVAEAKGQLEAKLKEIETLEVAAPIDAAAVREHALEIRKIVNGAANLARIFDLEIFLSRLQLKAIDCILATAARDPAEDEATSLKAVPADTAAGQEAGANGSTQDATEPKSCAEAIPLAEDNLGPRRRTLRAAAIAGSIPQLVANLAALRSLQLQPPDLARLLLERERLKTQLAYFEDVAALRAEEIRLQAVLVEALLVEADAWGQVHHHMRKFEHLGGGLGLSGRAALNPKGQVPVEARVELTKAIGALGLAAGASRQREEEIRYRLIALQQLRTARADAFALDSLHNLITPALAQLETYHAGGIKPETLANLGVGLANLGLLGTLVAKE